MTIARNASRTALSRKQKQTEAIIEEPGSTLNEPARQLSGREQIERLDRALAELPEAQRAAFVLCEIQQLSLKEAAEIENAAVGTIKSRVSRARDKLRSVLARSEVTDE